MSLKQHCIPCAEVVAPLSRKEAEALLQGIQPSWKLTSDNLMKLERILKFKNFKKGMEFTNKVADIAEKEGHHPNIYITFTFVKIELYSHNISGLSENDFILAGKIDGILE